MRYEICDPRNDGFTVWPVKQDLIKLKYYIDDALADCPTFSGEAEFIEELEATKTFNIMKRK